MSAAVTTRHAFSHRDLNLSYLDSAPGDSARETVLLLHGFPDHAEMWLAQIDALHNAGYRCIAPDTIGCGHSQMAPQRQDYNVRHIVEDHAALLDHLNIAKANVIGHDWGAVQAWMLAAWHPEKVSRLVAISVGHPVAYAKAGIDQKLAAWYIAFFTLAGLAERLLMGSGRFSMARLFSTHPEVDAVIERLRQPGRLTAALRIYRASLVTVLLKSHPRVKAPTLGIWSEGDRYLVESQMRNSVRWVEGSWDFDKISGGHWIPIDQPAYLNQKILAHLSQ